MPPQIWYKKIALSLLAFSPLILAQPSRAAGVSPIITVSNGGNASKPLSTGVKYYFTIDLNPTSSTYNYASAVKVAFCGQDTNLSSKAYCAHDVYDTIIPSSVKITSFTPVGNGFEDTFDETGNKSTISFEYFSATPATEELYFTETFSASRNNEAFFYGISNPALDGYATTNEAFIADAPSNFTGSPLSCSFTGSYNATADTTASCSFKFSFAAPATSVPTGSVPELSTWTMLIVGLGFVGGAMRKRGRLLSPAVAG